MTERKWIRSSRSIANGMCVEVSPAVRDTPAEADEVRPRIVCLCGSTRFMDAFHAAGWEFTLAGYIVLSVGVAKHVQTPDGGHVAEALGPGVAEALDELHKRKIDLADEIYVLNPGGYIGESTASEIRYARQRGKGVRFLEPLDEARLASHE